MMREPRLTSEWLKQNGFRGTDYEQWKRYEMDAGETSDPRARKQWEIQSFMKDPYGMPYVPGSSLKGSSSGRHCWVWEFRIILIVMKCWRERLAGMHRIGCQENNV